MEAKENNHDVLPNCEENDEVQSAPLPTKEQFYDKLPVSKRTMDIVCVALIAATVITFLIGVYLANR